MNVTKEDAIVGNENTINDSFPIIDPSRSGEKRYISWGDKLQNIGLLFPYCPLEIVEYFNFTILHAAGNAPFLQSNLHTLER
jgi:hypothetical protein